MRPHGTKWTVACATIAMLACSNGDEGPDDPGNGGTTQAEPARELAGSAAQPPPLRRVRRLSADQLYESLLVATGQPWSDFEQHASTLGRPDYFEVTEEDDRLSVAFDKIVGDAARETCHAAVEEDRATADPEARVILRHVALEDRNRAALVENLKYLLMRFHAVRVSEASDPRLEPWLAVLEAELDSSDLGTDSVGDEMALRWEAVCVGLATHPNFLTY